MLLREKVFTERTVVMTSATLELGGSFDALAGTLGLLGAGAPSWNGVDVGSPFDYPKQAMAYVAGHLPAPGRDGTAPEQVDEIEALIRAAGGRTLGLFSSMRAARAAEHSGPFVVHRAPGSGDDAIVDLATELDGGPRRVVVVTADRGLRDRLPGNVLVVGPRTLLG